MALAGKSRVSKIVTPDCRSSEILDVSTWHFPQDTQAEMAALTTWCRVRQQQQTPLDDTTQDDNEMTSSDADDDDDHEDFTTACADADSCDTQLIVSTFLDALAVIICCKKLASFATCTYLIQHEDDCTILLARNAAWTGADTSYPEYLTMTLECYG
jgi:hypothetical protein